MVPSSRALLLQTVSTGLRGGRSQSCPLVSIPSGPSASLLSRRPFGVSSVRADGQPSEDAQTRSTPTSARPASLATPAGSSLSPPAATKPAPMRITKLELSFIEAVRAAGSDVSLDRFKQALQSSLAAAPTSPTRTRPPQRSPPPPESQPPVRKTAKSTLARVQPIYTTEPFPLSDSNFSHPASRTLFSSPGEQRHWKLYDKEFTLAVASKTHVEEERASFMRRVHDRWPVVSGFKVKLAAKTLIWTTEPFDPSVEDFTQPASRTVFRGLGHASRWDQGIRRCYDPFKPVSEIERADFMRRWEAEYQARAAMPTKMETESS